METNTPKEGKMTKAIEKRTARIPSGCYLTAAVAAMGTSLILKCCKKNHAALFVGQWAAPFLIMGLYNKLVKTQGHDQQDENPGMTEDTYKNL